MSTLLSSYIYSDLVAKSVKKKWPQQSYYLSMISVNHLEKTTTVILAY